MPGIAGLIGKVSKEEGLRRVEVMLQAMMYEPFYSTGVYCNEQLGVYAGWVAHPHSFSDCMPVQSEDGNITIVLCGEIFTSEEQLRGLSRAGHVGVGSNARHLIDLYQKLGNAFFEELNGTFSGIVVNSQRGTVELFNDRMGFEKIYFADVAAGDLFQFASESKALLRVNPGLRQFDSQGLAQFLAYGSTLEEKTLFKGVSLLPPASVWEFTPTASVRKRTYFRPLDWQTDSLIGPEIFQEKFNEIFKRVLPRYFAGELHPGISLTGGWDTRMIMACHRAPPGSLPCYTFAAESGNTTDVQQAIKVANLLRQQHSVLRLRSEFLTDFAQHAEHTVYASDGNGDVCLSHEIYLNRLARKVAGARVTGNFGSEVLRGMSTFKELPSRSDWVNGELKLEIAKCREQWNAGNTKGENSFAVFREIPWKLSTTFRLANSQLPTRSPYLDNEILKLACISPMSVCKDSAFPQALVRSENPQLLKIATDRGEAGNGSALGRTIRHAFYSGTFKVDYFLNEGMPDFLSIVLDAPRLHSALTFGHKYLEYRRWFRGPLREYADGMLNNSNSFVSGLIGRQSVERTLSSHVSGVRNQLEQINVWLTLELINRSLLRAS